MPNHREGCITILSGASPSAACPHGYARYKLDGCRCNACGFAVSEYTRARRNAIRRGAWRVDADLVRAHVRSLAAAGMGRRRVVAVAGVSESTLSLHLYGRAGRAVPATMRRDLAQKLLAVAPDLAPNARVPVVGTARRIQALVAIGWTLTEVAAGIGWTVQNLARLVCPSTGCVAVRTAREVADLYERLSMTPNAGPVGRCPAASTTAGRWRSPAAQPTATGTSARSFMRRAVGRRSRLATTAWLTYTQASESGASLRAAGWRVIASRPAHPGWSRPARPRRLLGTEWTERTLWEAS